MSAVSKIIPSVISGAIDTTITLANINLNLALIKLEPPKEFMPLGMELSRIRRDQAESGSHHQTARKLGELFRALIPSTPSLIRAYGIRASEISQSEFVNPRSSTSSAGIFADRVGIDATSTWAAATSGPAAIAAYLLGCMLARMFTAVEATALWYELVEQRKRQIFALIAEGLAEPADSNAAQQELTREQLKEWDGSVRAWIQSADQAKSEEQSRLMSAISEARLSVPNEDTVLDSVTAAWATALTAMENLVCGIGQRVQSAAILVGVSAWHIYPDMNILGDTIQVIKQNDPLVAGGGLLTLGLQMDTPEDDSIFWTLPLAYLRYYGDPVRTLGSVGPNNARITAAQLSFVVLGCIFRSWGEVGRDPLKAATWFTLLHRLTGDEYPDDISQKQFLKGEIKWEPNKSLKGSWFSILSNAAASLQEAEGEERDTLLKLIGLGRRRSSFIGQVPVLFGLLDIRNVLSLLNSDDARVEFLRQVAASLELPADSFIIVYKTEDHPMQFATVAPLIPSWPKGNHNARWLCKNLDGNAPPTFPTEVIFKVPNGLTGSINWNYYIGDRSSAAIHQLIGGVIQSDGEFSGIGRSGDGLRRTSFSTILTKFHFSTNHLWHALRRDLLDRNKFLSFLKNGPPHRMDGTSTNESSDILRFFAGISSLYTLLPGATISAKIFSKPLRQCDLAEKFRENAMTRTPSWLYQLSREEAFACLAYCESGSCDLHPKDLGSVFALSSGNSIFVCGKLLCDPAERTEGYEIRRLVGNIGRPGIALLIPPQSSRTAPRDEEAWPLIRHESFDGQLHDRFQETTLHLSFTEFCIRLGVQAHGNRDSDAYVIESVVSVHDCGKWVADIVILPMFDDSDFHACPPCGGDHPTISPPSDLITVDNWHELLDTPEGNFIVRAHGNWLARLALAAVCRQLGHIVLALPSSVCWYCCKKMMEIYQDAVEKEKDKHIALIC